MSVYLQDADVTLYHGDALEVLRTLPDRSVHMCATSPPFYGLRSYLDDGHEDKHIEIGLEDTPDQWVARLVDVFREVRRVLRDDGTLWVEIGDSYAGGGGFSANAPTSATSKSGKYGALGALVSGGIKPTESVKAKDLLGAPWLLAFALRADGWYLRSEIIWARPNAMPESVTDRPTKSHSTIFLLSKKARYYFDADAIREPHQHDGRKVTTVQQGNGSIQHRDGERWPGSGANARSVWWQATEPTPYAHFATWPRKLVTRMILAGCPEGGVVLDPFAGSGTTLLVARNHGRHSIGIELNADYCAIAADRLAQQSLLTELA